MTLADERLSTLEFVNFERSRVLRLIESIATDRSDIKPLLEIATKLFDELGTSLALRMDEIIAEDGDLQPDVASDRIQRLFRDIQTAIGWLATTAYDQAVIPRELYRLTSWFLSAVTVPGIVPPAFILKIDPVDLGTTEWRQILSNVLSSSRGSKYPALEQAFKNIGLVFIQIPAPLADLSGSVDWPLVFHECVHALELTANSIGPLYPDLLPRDWTSLNALARAGEIDARNALVTEELLCDNVALSIGGPGFVSSFLRRYSSVCSVAYEQITHPRLDIRVEYLATRMSELGFSELATKARERLLSDQSMDTVMPPEPCIDTASKASKTYLAGSVVFNKESCDRELSEKRISGPQLIEDMKALRPAVLSPPTLFSVTSFCPDLAQPRFGPLLADMVRLRATEERFKKLNLRG